MRYKHTIILGIILSMFTLALYFINYLIFGEAHHLVQTFGEELAFMPLYVFITAVVAEQLLWRSEKNEISRRTNALVGTFFNELGYDIIKILTKHDNNFAQLNSKIQLDKGWDPAAVKSIHKMSESYKYGAPQGIEDFLEMGQLLGSRKDFLLIMMSNASLIEKDEFSELLLAVNHIYEAMKTIEDTSIMDKDFIDHVHGDLQNVYRCFIKVWASYLLFIEKEDQYLFKLAVEQSKRIRLAGHAKI